MSLISNNACLSLESAVKNAFLVSLDPGKKFLNSEFRIVQKREEQAEFYTLILNLGKQFASSRAKNRLDTVTDGICALQNIAKALNRKDLPQILKLAQIALNAFQGINHIPSGVLGSELNHTLSSLYLAKEEAVLLRNAANAELEEAELRMKLLSHSSGIKKRYENNKIFSCSQLIFSDELISKIRKACESLEGLAFFTQYFFVNEDTENLKVYKLLNVSPLTVEEFRSQQNSPNSDVRMLVDIMLPLVQIRLANEKSHLSNDLAIEFSKYNADYCNFNIEEEKADLSDDSDNDSYLIHNSKEISEYDSKIKCPDSLFVYKLFHDMLESFGQTLGASDKEIQADMKGFRFFSLCHSSKVLPTPIEFALLSTSSLPKTMPEIDQKAIYQSRLFSSIKLEEKKSEKKGNLPPYVNKSSEAPLPSQAKKKKKKKKNSELSLSAPTCHLSAATPVETLSILPAAASSVSATSKSDSSTRIAPPQPVPAHIVTSLPKPVPANAPRPLLSPIDRLLFKGDRFLSSRTYHDRVADWLYRPAVALSRAPYNQLSQKAQADAVWKHAFPAIIDRFLGTNYCISGKWNKTDTLHCLVVEVEGNNIPKKRYVLQYCEDENGVIYHRYAGEKSNSDLIDDIICGKLLNFDFPAIEAVKKEIANGKKEKPKLQQVNNIQLQLLSFGVVTFHLDNCNYSLIPLSRE